MSVPKSKFRALLLALAAVLFAGLVASAFRLDGWAREEIVAAQGKAWKKSTTADAYRAISRYGDWPWLMLAGGAGLFLAWRAGRRDWRRILITAMVASTVAGALVNTVRLTSGRTRPAAAREVPQGWYGPFHSGRLTIGVPDYNAFPSGHTATAVGFAGVLLLARPLIGAAALVLALGVGWSRMQLGAHNLSDVTVGALVALVVAWICWRVSARRGDEIAAWVARKFRRKP